MGIKKICSKLFRNHRTTREEQPVYKWITCRCGHWYNEMEYESCPNCKEGYPKVVDSLLLYQTYSLKCPNCRAILSVFYLMYLVMIQGIIAKNVISQAIMVEHVMKGKVGGR